MSVLFVDATTRAPQESRTFQLASAYLDALPSQQVLHLDLKAEGLSPLTGEDTTRREEVIKGEDSSHPLAKYAHQFAQADHIVVAAPYWDLSFPSVLKIYVEYICATGITFAYGEHGVIPLCSAKSFTYITTSGGEIYQGANMGYDYLATLCKAMFGIHDVRCLSAQMLDIEGMDEANIMKEAKLRAVQLANQ